jgi:hypothetical protein
MGQLVRPDPDISAKARLLIEQTSMAKAARQLNLSEATVARLVGGLMVTPGTALLAKAALEKLATEAA